jgi:hypothetical protein
MNCSGKTLAIVTISLLAVVVWTPKIIHAEISSPAPSPASGDWWRYNFQISVEGLTLTGPITEALAAQQSINVQTTNYNSYRLTVTGTGTVNGTILNYAVTGSWTVSGEDYVRGSDLADIKSHLSFLISGQVATPVPTSFTVTRIDDTTNIPPSETLQFPLSLGGHWSLNVTSTTSTTTYSSVNPTPVINVTSTTQSRNSDVINYALTSVPAGSFDAYQIRTSSASGTTQAYYSPEVENMIKIQDYNSAGALIDSFSLSDYNAWVYKSTIGISTGGKDYTASIETNVSPYNLHKDDLSIIFQVTGTDDLTGKAVVWIPLQANNTDIKVFIDSTPTTSSISKNATQYQIQFNYPLSTHTIAITYAAARQQSPFLQQFLFPIILAIAGAVAAVVIIVVMLITRKRNPSSLDVGGAGLLMLREVLVITSPIALALSIWMGWIGVWDCTAASCTASRGWAQYMFLYFFLYALGSLLIAVQIERKMVNR